MSNPWLGIPLADYEGHMESSSVQQLGALSNLFAEALAICRPVSVAVVGVAGGNGLERIDGSVTRRVVGFDINPSYLDAVRRRFPGMEGLELICVDLAEEPIPTEIAACSPLQLVHAALVFEHAGVGPCLDNVLSLVAAEGTLSVVLQLQLEADQAEPGVGKSAFESMQNLGATFTLVDPVWLRSAIEARGFRMTRETRQVLPSGKGFWMGVFVRAC